MNTPALHADENRTDNHLSWLEKGIAGLILMLIWALVMQTYVEW